MPLRAGFFGAASSQRNDNHAVGRVDWNVSSTTIANFRYTRGRPDQLQPRAAAQNSRTRDALHESGSFQITHFTPTWSSETRYGVNLNDVRGWTASSAWAWPVFAESDSTPAARRFSRADTRRPSRKASA